jgi:benzil reductase ((S)-benzoin forming)
MYNQISIITGSNRGIGQAIQNQLLESGIPVISINRNAIEQQHPLHLINIPFDLSNIPGLPGLVQKINLYLQKHPFDNLWLINNAAMLGSIQKMSGADVESMAETVETNLISPMNLTSLLLASPLLSNKKIRIINISSGAAFQPIEGLGAYCISKAGLEMFSRMLALEEGKERDLKSITIGPGVVDTRMQKIIRSSDQKDFPRVDQFRAFKEKGILGDPSNIAFAVYTLLLEDSFTNGDSVDLSIQ